MPAGGYTGGEMKLTREQIEEMREDILANNPPGMALDDINALCDMAAAPLAAPEWRPMESAPLDGTEIEILMRHHSYWLAMKTQGKAEADSVWQGPVRAKWIDSNGGGWTHNGMAGSPMGWRPIGADHAREAVEQLAERLEEAVSQHNHDPFSQTVNHRLANLAMDAAALLREPQGEPVAWRCRSWLTVEWGDWNYSDRKPRGRPHNNFEVEALFAAPAARQPEQEVPEGCTPADAARLREGNFGLAQELHELREAVLRAVSDLEDFEKNTGIFVGRLHRVSGNLLAAIPEGEKPADARQPDAQIKAAEGCTWPEPGYCLRPDCACKLSPAALAEELIDLLDAQPDAQVKAAQEETSQSEPGANVRSNMAEPQSSSCAAPRPSQAQPIAWMREWEGDDSDLGHMIFEADERDLDEPRSRWTPLYASPPAAVQFCPERACRERGKCCWPDDCVPEPAAVGELERVMRWLYQQSKEWAGRSDELTASAAFERAADYVRASVPGEPK